jgi:hypothetical protein
MKHLTLILTALLLAGSVIAAEKIVPGPKGGKMLDQQTEFYVEKDRTVVLAFYGADLKPQPVGAQTAVIWADAKSGRVKLEMEKKGDVLVSKTALPEGDGYNVMVQLKSTPDAKAQNHKVNLNIEPCTKCQRAEYACICEQHDHDDHGHDHSAPGHKH